ncbi:hypothetical protein [Streptomyces sp. Wb2n-11]|uniref:hypothetical protein n=1 Tax=Streptomyces sp. Wb2n-11 TaxID=1030533 RepID=UPI000B125BD6|nr:hypothetical protein [Streptomyces sp. Wb2n-11]
MKYMKAASAVAISMIAAGVASPAVAAGQLGAAGVASPAVAAGQLGDAVVESVPRTATEAVQHLKEGDSKKLVLEGAEGAMEATRALGGLPLGD